MSKWILGIILFICAGAWFVYNKFDSQITRLTPEVIAALQQTVSQENEAAVIKPPLKSKVYPPSNPLKNLYFGDLHVHTSWSFDANLNGNRIGPQEAYQFAQGKELVLMSGEIAQLNEPLDFAAITDHAESFGLFEGCADVNATAAQKEFCELFENPSLTVFLRLRNEGVKRPPVRMSFCGDDGSFCIEHGKTTWRRIQEAADRVNQPGIFTTFYAYEYSPSWPKRGSTHRNVIFRNTTVPELVVSAFDAPTALDLWGILENTCLGDCDVLTIPHNLNRYYGKAFSRQDEDGADYTLEDWKRRKKYEPLVEIFQAKGNSECVFGLGSTDEECGFEQGFPICEDGESIACAGANSYARDGLKLGLELQDELDFNPFRIGFIGSTDTHNSNPGDTEEWDFRGKAGYKDSSASKRLEKRKFGPAVPISHNPGGLAAVWAEENTRDALFDALQRKETFATSGTRIRLRFFSGWGFDEAIFSDVDMIGKAYETGVPMGGEMLDQQDASTNPKLLVWAVKDPINANLDKIQVIKGWIENGEQRESVIDVVCADGRLPSVDGKCSKTSALVDLNTCQVSAGDGAVELKVLWEDKNFNPSQSSFYYIRVLQNPTCRWSSYDAIRLGLPPIKEVAPTIQERAWSSPIWYSPDDS